MLKSFLITLQAPARVSSSETLLDGSRLILEGETLTPPRFPFWPSCADLLVNSSANEFVGLCYYVGEDYKRAVESILPNLNSNIAQFVDSATGDATPYLNSSLPPCHLQIKWSIAPADKVEVAQIDSDYWYYLEDGDHLVPVAIGLNYIDEILSDYDFRFPEIGHIDSFQPEFVEAL